MGAERFTKINLKYVTVTTTGLYKRILEEI
jgi:hypothetical protein